MSGRQGNPCSPKCYKMLKKKLAFKTIQGKAVSWLARSRSEKAPRCGFHPPDGSDQNYCGFLGPPYCNKKADPDRNNSSGSNELLVSMVAQ